MKALVVYWSENGHTKSMAQTIANELKKNMKLQLLM